MQNGKTIKTRKNVDFNVDIFRFQKKDKFLLNIANKNDNMIVYIEQYHVQGAQYEIQETGSLRVDVVFLLMHDRVRKIICHDR